MDGLEQDLTRRDIIKGATALAGASLLSGTSAAQDLQQTDNVAGGAPVQPVAFLFGTVDKNPNQIPELQPGGVFFERRNQKKTFYTYIYQQPSGAEWYINQDQTQWRELRMNPETQVDEVRVEDYESFFNHTFARPEAPDLKNWLFDPATVTKVNSEIELDATASLTTTQRGNYPPGTEAIPGIAWRVTGTPTAGTALAGYYDTENGIGVGEDATDSFVFVRQGGTEKRIYRSDWNGYTPDSRVFVNDDPTVVRFPHLFYGGGNLKARALLHENGSTDLKTLHTVTPDTVDDTLNEGPPIQQPNLPVRFESESLTGGNLRANACHYEFGEQDAEVRINGEHFTGVSVSETGWTPLIAWQKRSGWEMVNIKPQKISVSTDSSDVKLGLQLDPILSGGTWTLPTNTSSSETAIEVATDVTLDSPGERRWPGYAVAGQANKSGALTNADVTFNLPANQEIVLVAQGVTGTATVNGAIGWEEYF